MFLKDDGLLLVLLYTWEIGISTYIFECENVENVFRSPNYLCMQKISNYKILLWGDGICPNLSKNIYFVGAQTLLKLSKIRIANVVGQKFPNPRFSQF